MIDYIMSKGLNERLLMSLYPRRRVEWDAPFHPNTPRNFATNTMSWTTLTPAMAAIGTNDFEWEIDSKWLGSGTTGYIFYESAGTPSNNTIGWYVHLSNASYSGFVSHTGLVTDPVNTYYDDAITSSSVLITPVINSFALNTARFIIKIKRVGAVVSIYVNNILAKTITGTAPIALINTSTGSLASRANCNITSVYLKNLTTNTVVWQAAYSDLYITNNPWPSTIMRNFSTEPATWYDAYLAWAGLTDYEWTINFTPHSSDNATIFGTDTTRGLRVYIYGGKLHTMLGLDYTTASPNVVINEEVTVTVSYVDGVKTSIINGQTMATIGNIATPVPASLTSSFGGTIREITLKDHATGKTVWSYPSFAENTRLVTLSNVLTSNGVFEGATAGVVRRVKTALDLRGNSTSKTFVCRCYIPSHAADGKLYVNSLISQGSTISATSLWVFRFDLWEDYRNTPIVYLHLQFIGTSFRGVNLDITSTKSLYLDRWITLSGVIDYVTGFAKVYVDGALINSTSFIAETFSQGSGSALSDAVSILHDPYQAYISDHKIAWAMVYEGALTDQEILMHNSIIL